MKRPPIVVVMGHVDHGKTTLLDTIRKTNIANKEAGGITQSVGAYEIIHNNERLTFIDTPGHEAFSKMRARGAKIADLAILLVAADDGVKPQTKDALQKIKEAGIPFLVAINKIDKPNADVEKTKNDLMQAGVYLEGFGGDVSFQQISAKNGDGISELLDLVVLATDVLNLEYDPNLEAQGVILTARRDPKRGNVAGVVIKNGTLSAGQHIKTSSAAGKIKILEDFTGRSMKSLFPSAPAMVLGFVTLPAIGEEFRASDKKLEAEVGSVAKIEQSQFSVKKNDASVRLIVKAPEAGSLEAVIDYVKSIATSELPYLIIDSSIGEVQQADAKLADTTGSIILNFGSPIDRAADTIIKAKNIPILTTRIIYELDAELKEFITRKTMKVPAVFEILALFNVKKNDERVIGGKLTGNKVRVGEEFRVLGGEGQELGTGRLVGMKHGKDSITEARPGSECGFQIQTTVPVETRHKLLFNIESQKDKQL